MPRANPFDPELIASLEAVEIKKTSETATTALTDPDVEVSQGRLGCFRVCAFYLYVSAETTVTLEDETTAIAVISLAAKTGIWIPLPQQGYLSAAGGNELKIKTLNTAKITISVWGAENE